MSEIKSIFIILVDISGYTRFIKFHKISLLHAEKIIAELMESILKQVEVPVITHEILGDAISLYAIDEEKEDQAIRIYGQLQKYFSAFRVREAALISGCSLCRCDACKQVGKLKLKAILHYGKAAFTKIQNIRKISGEDIILSHRLLKNSLTSKEYILMTKAFADRSPLLDLSGLQKHTEHDPDLGTIHLLVRDLETNISAANLSFWKKLNEFWKIERSLFSFRNKTEKKIFRNLPYERV